MINRRVFLRNISALSAAALVIPNKLQAFTSGKTIGIQLYTIRELVNKDFLGTLGILAGIGFNSVEAAGYNDKKFYGFTPKEYEKICNDFGILPISSHSMVNRENAGLVIQDTKEAGMSYLVLPSIPKDRRESLDDYKKLADEFNTIGEKCRQADLKFGYHNHAFEFEKIDEKIPYDILLERTDPKLCFMQVDLYWMVYGGYDPLDYFNQYPGRFELWHVKDMADGTERESTEIGNGKIDFPAIFNMKDQAGMEYYFLEQESFKMDPVESITQSFNYLSSI